MGSGFAGHFPVHVLSAVSGSEVEFVHINSNAWVATAEGNNVVDRLEAGSAKLDWGELDFADTIVH